jgi:hypothetical protein
VSPIGRLPGGLLTPGTTVQPGQSGVVAARIARQAGEDG